jgi:hypothetical protein
MENLGALLRERLDQVLIENETLRAGFAALPYKILKDTRLSTGARLAYAILLMYAWQEGSCFPGQQRMATDMGVTDRHLRRFLNELREHGYVTWRKTMPWGSNTYTIIDVRSKLRSKPNRTSVSGSSGHRRPVRADARVLSIDAADRPKTIDKNAG